MLRYLWHPNGRKGQEGQENHVIKSLIICPLQRIRMVKLKRMTWVGHTAGMGERFGFKESTEGEIK